MGGGPAGVAAAITLTRGGRDVVLLDKAEFPRDKCCGDGLTTLALRELEMLGFDPSAVDDWQVVNGAVLRSPSGRQVTVPLPVGRGTFAAVCPRRQLDAALVTLATKSGVDARDGHGFDGQLEQQADHVTIGVSGHRSIAARYVIAADGMWSPVRKAAGLALPGYLGEWHAFRGYVRDVTGPAADDLYVWFERDFLPGYAWSFPLPEGRANVGFGVMRDGARRIQEMKQLWTGLLDRPHIRAALGPAAALEGRHLAWPIPARVDRVRLSAGRVLLTGDAAAASDVMTGEGIGQALLSGRAAAEAVLEAGALQPGDGSGPLRACRATPPRRRPQDVRRALSSPRPRARARGAIKILDRSGAWGRRNFARWMFEDEPRALLVTPRRWHRGVLSRPGASFDDGDGADGEGPHP